MQIWPLLVNFAQAMRRAAASTLAVSSMMVGDLPPSSRVTEARCFDAAAITILPIAGAPVKKMWLKGSASAAVEVSMPPSITATSLSSNTSSMMLLMIADACGVCSEGLSMTQFPAATALITGPKVRFTGKFHGAMTNTTPLGS